MLRVPQMIILALVCLMFTNVSSLSDQELDNKNKLTACIKLVKSALHYNKDYLPSVAEEILQEEKTEKVKDLEAKFLFRTLLNCYTTLPLIKSAEYINKPSHEAINPLKKENSIFLQFERYTEKYADNAQKYNKDLSKLEETMKNTQTELVSLNEMIDQAVKSYVQQEKKKEQFDNAKFEQRNQKRQREESEQPIYNDGMADLNFMKTLDPSIKIGLGLGLLLIIFLALYLGLKSLMASEQKDKKKKKK